MIRITDTITVPDSSIELSPIQSRGPGGQHVNKVATGVHLRFDFRSASLPERVVEGLAAMKDSRISARGVIVIKAQRFKSQEKNRADALERLAGLIRDAGRRPGKRKATRPTRASRERRLAAKARRADIKSMRKKIEH